MRISKKLYTLSDDGKFPNSELPVIHYMNVLELPWLFASRSVKHLFKKNGWTNNWRSGLLTYNHYHSTAHEVIGVIHGETTLQLGGPGGIRVRIVAGDALIIPAGVSHKNLGEENDAICIGGYYEGREFDIKTGKKGERPKADITIAALNIPEKDPVYGSRSGLPKIWNEKEKPHKHAA